MQMAREITSCFKLKSCMLDCTASRIQAMTQKNEIRKIQVLLSMPEPWTHYFEVEMIVGGVSPGEMYFTMPAWTPGSYLIREFARNVQAFSASESSGKTLSWEKVNKNAWRVKCNRPADLLIKYRVYAFEPTVRTSFLDDSHGYINGASVFLYLEGYLKVPYQVSIVPYSGWTQISTSLEPVGGLENAFFAQDYDVLADSPIEIGCQKVLEFEAKGIPHFISIYGEGNCNSERVKDDLKKIVETAAEIVGEIPYKSYTFLLQLLKEGSGGLEHAASTTLQMPRWSFQPEESYGKFLRLAAHEYFHVWNVKRIRPSELGPFDYTRENYTRLLWISEGFTDYYEGLILRRAALITPEKFLEHVSKKIADLRQTPGRLVESAADASFDAWIKQYRQDPHTPNATVSYYLKGHLIGLVLDLEIRKRTKGMKSLDDVMRLLYQKFYQEELRGFSEKEFRAVCTETAGSPLDELLDRYACGTEDMDFAPYLAYAGLQFAPAALPQDSSPKGYLGIALQILDGKPVIAGIPAGTPAYDQGLNVNDEILGIDGFRATMETIQSLMECAVPGATIDFLIARGDRLRTISVRLGEKPSDEFRIAKVKDVLPEQKAIYESWLCAPWKLE
jgi:predicted metalloprotease with PDZ domain